MTTWRERLARTDRARLGDTFGATLVASLLLEAGAAALLARSWLTGYALLSAGAALLVGRLKANAILTPERRRKLAIAILSVAAVSELGVLFKRSHGSGFAPLFASEGSVGSGKYRGVILLTDAQPRTIVAPPPPGRSNVQSQPNQPMSIPFDGVYWLYKPPDRQPPKDSYTIRGSPAVMAFRSSDRIPLEMEARQDFVTPIDLSCCSRIEVEIANADRGPGSVWLQLILLDQRAAGSPSQTLGVQPVKSRPAVMLGSQVQPLPEILSFAIPRDSRIREFDAARVLFLHIGNSAARSSRIAIQRFRFVPAL